MKQEDVALADEILSNQIDLFRFASGEQRRALQVLTDLQSELVRKLPADMTAFSRARVEKLLAQTNKIIDDYYDRLNGQVDVKGIASQQAQATATSMVNVGLDIALPTQAVMKEIASTWMLDGAPSADWWDKQASDLKFKFAGQVRQGFAQGESTTQIVRRIIGSVGSPGIMEVSRRNAAALVHTSVMQIASDSRLAVFRANKDIIKGVEQLSTLDSHTSLVCVARSGMQWTLAGAPIGNTSLPFRIPPLHFNCRSILTPLTKTLAEITGKDISEVFTGSTRASDLGQIDAKTTFSEFLKRHDDAYVDKLLGKGRADLWRRGKITLSELVSGNGRPLTLAKLKKLHTKG